MALAATRSSVVAMVLYVALWQILIGLGLGIPAALFSQPTAQLRFEPNAGAPYPVACHS